MRRFDDNILQAAELKLVALRKRCDELIQLRRAWDNAYNSTLEALLEFDKNNTTEANKTFAETFALTVLYKQLSKDKNNE